MAMFYEDPKVISSDNTRYCSNEDSAHLSVKYTIKFVFIVFPNRKNN